MWLSFVFPACVALAWCVLPGLAVTLGLRLRADAALLFAPAVSLAIITSSALLAPFAGVSWGPLPPLILTVISAAIVWIARVSMTRKRQAKADAHTHPRRSHKVAWTRRLGSVYAQTFIALGVAAGLFTVITVAILGNPTNFSQTFDAVFHLNAVRWVLDEGNASSLDLSHMVYGPDRALFYPAGWHGFASLVLTTLGNDDVRIGTNATILITLAVVWPTSVIAFVRTWTPGPLVRFSLIPAAILSAAVPAFPYLFLDFGALYPNLLGYSLVLAFLALFGAVLGLRRRLCLSWPALVVLGFAVATAIVFSHPSGAMAVMVAAIALTVGYAVSVGGRRRRLLPLKYVAIAGGLLAVTAFVWPIIRPAGKTASSWGPSMGSIDAVVQALFMTPFWGTPQWPLMVVAVLGIVVAVRYKEYGTLFMWGAFIFLWIIVASWTNLNTRTAIVGPWYSDPFRLAALLPLAVVPLGAMGFGYALSRTRMVLDWLLPRKFFVPAAIVMTVCALMALTLATQFRGHLRYFRADVTENYAVENGANVISAHELALIKELPALVEPGALIYVNPWHGEALIYGLTGTDTTSRHQQGPEDKNEQYLDQNLNRIDSDPKVCQAIDRLGTDYVAVFYGPTINNVPADEVNREGLFGLSRVKSLTLVKREDGAYLYKVTGCP